MWRSSADAMWSGGPVFQSRIILADGSVDALSLAQIRTLEGVLGLQDIHQRTGETANDALAGSDWRQHVEVRAKWMLAEDVTVGVRVFPRWLDCGFMLGIPPRFLADRFGDYEWDLAKPWVSASAVRLHQLVIARIRRLDSALAVRGAMIGEEGVCVEFGVRERAIVVAGPIWKAGAFSGLDDTGLAVVADSNG